MIQSYFVIFHYPRQVIRKLLLQSLDAIANIIQHNQAFEMLMLRSFSLHLKNVMEIQLYLQYTLIILTLKGLHWFWR